MVNAFETSRHLKNGIELATQGNGELTVLAHSLGNILTSSAIEKYGFRPDRYFSIDSVVPIESYDPGQLVGNRGVTMQPMMTNPDWQSYTEKLLYCSNWHMLFEDGSVDENGNAIIGDERQQLTWRDYFENVPSYTENI